MSIEEGKCYTWHDDGLYKVIAIGTDWVLVLCHSFNHHVCCPRIFKIEDFVSEGMEEETDSWRCGIFDNLKFYDDLSLKEND